MPRLFCSLSLAIWRSSGPACRLRLGLPPALGADPSPMDWTLLGCSGLASAASCVRARSGLRRGGCCFASAAGLVSAVEGGAEAGGAGCDVAFGCDVVFCAGLATAGSVGAFAWLVAVWFVCLASSPAVVEVGPAGASASCCASAFDRACGTLMGGRLLRFRLRVFEFRARRRGGRGVLCL